jgi:hypothetical protein
VKLPIEMLRRIEATDGELDRSVYDLYGLRAEDPHPLPKGEGIFLVERATI